MAIQPDSSHTHRRHQSRVTATLKALIRTRITTGALVVLPILITIWVVWVVFSWLRWCSEWMVRAVLTSQWLGRQLQSLGMTWTGFTEQELHEPKVQWSVGIFSVALTFFLLYIIGMFAANIVGRRVLDLVDQVVERVPLAKTIYRSIKQILGTFSGDKGQNFQRVALIPSPARRCAASGSSPTSSATPSPAKSSVPSSSLPRLTRPPAICRYSNAAISPSWIGPSRKACAPLCPPAFSNPTF
jgi:uncharacterized membrane protein